MAFFLSFIWLSSIPVIYVSHRLFLFICWWTLGCFYVLAIVNSAAVNIGVHVSFWITVFSRYIYICPGELYMCLISLLDCILWLWEHLACLIHQFILVSCFAHHRLSIGLLSSWIDDRLSQQHWFSFLALVNHICWVYQTTPDMRQNQVILWK